MSILSRITREANVKTIRTIPDARLVAEGKYILDLPYMQIQANGDVTVNVDDILYETKIDPFMSRLKNSSASEVIAAFQKRDTASLLASLGPDLGSLMARDLVSPNTYVFVANKGTTNLRNMAAVIDGNTVNNILFPSYRGALGQIIGAEQVAQDLCNARGYGKLRSDVYAFNVRDSSKKQVTSYNGAAMFIKVPYKGNKTDLNSINVVVANWGLTRVTTIARSALIMVVPASNVDEGYVIFKTNEPGYFIIADK